MNEIKVGTRVYNRGDMANPDQFGTITKIEGGNITIESDNTGLELYPDVERLAKDKPYVYTVPACMVSTIDKGNGLTRIVTEAAYLAFRKARVDALYASLGGK